MLSYESISLKTYIEIANSGNLSALIISGRHNEKELSEAWEQIVKLNADANQDANYDLYLDNVKMYGFYIEEYNYVKAMLLCLRYFVDSNYIAELKSLGYKIDTSGSKAYLESLIACERRSDNLLTKIESKYKEIKSSSKKDGEEAPTLGSLIAQVSFGVGFNIPETVGLAQFNEYKKLIKEKYGRKRDNQAIGNS